jgi:hypothetical protein
MTIIRTVHDKSNPYVMLNKFSLWDKDLSLCAVGLWSRLMSRPDDWKFRVQELAKSCGRSNESINRIINELVEKGYAYRYQTRDEKGRNGPWEILVFESKKSIDEIKEILPQRQKPDSAKPDSEKRSHTNTELTNPSSLRSEVKEAAASRCSKKELVAASSIREQLKKSKVKPEDWDEVLCYYEHNKAEIDSKNNPIGWLIKMWEVGKHKQKKRNQEVIKARKKWAESRCYTTGAGSMCATKEGLVKTDGSGQTVFKWDSDDLFWQVNSLGFTDFD